MHAFAIFVLVVTALAVTLAVGARVWLATGSGQRWLAGELSRRSGHEIRFRKLRGSLLWNARVDGLSVDGRRLGDLKLDWSLADLIDKHPSLNLAVQGRVHGKIRVQGPLERMRIAGRLRAPHDGRISVRGQASWPQRRARLVVRFRNLEPNLPSQERMVLDGSTRVSLRGQTARFTLDGRYRHRRPDPQVPGASTQSAGGTIAGSGVVHARRASFILHVRDRGHTARMLANSAPPHETILRGSLSTRPPRLRLHTEPR